MDPDKFRSWQRVFRDFLCVSVGAFMLVYGTVFVHEPAVLAVVLGGGLAACGLPVGLRLDEWVKPSPEKKSDS